MARCQRDRLGDNSAQPVQVHDAVELPAESGGPGGEKNRILEVVAEDVAGESRPRH